MDRKRIFRLLMVLVTWSFFYAFPWSVEAAEFSADMISEIPEKTSVGKVYVKGNKIRYEFLEGDEKAVSITRLDNGVTWILMPEEKMYMEILGVRKDAIDPEIEKKIEHMAEKKYLGKEKVSGYVCEKYQFVYHEKTMGTMTQWFSKKLNYPIKIEHKSPSYYMFIEYKNIKEGGVSDSLFEVPAGYQKMQMPMMPNMPNDLE